MAYVTSRQHSDGILRFRLNPMTSALWAMSFSTWALPAFMAGTTCDVFDFAVRFSGPPLHLGCSWSFLVHFESQLHSLSTPGSVLIWGLLFSHHQRGLLVPHSTTSLVTTHELAGHSRTCPHYAGTKRGSRKLYTGQSSDYHVGVINYLWCHYFLLPLTFPQAGAVMIYNKIFSRVFCS